MPFDTTRTSTAAAIFTAALGAAIGAHATSFIDGGFETTTNGGGQLGYNTEASGWVTTGYNFLFTPGSADTTGVVGSAGALSLWGPNNGSANGLPATSPDGGNFVALDGDYETAALSQTIGGLTVGQRYTVGFDYGFSQQESFYTDTIQNLTVAFGANQSYTTPNYTLPSQGFSGWLSKSVTFVADSTSDTLSFLAYGNKPVPPFALVDGVTLTDPVPEPASWALMVAGVGVVGALARRRRAISRSVAIAAAAAG